jgi:hypothetical protein
MQVKKIYADEQDRGTLLCEQCATIKVITITNFKNIGRALKVKCGCGHVFLISIEVRKFYRKQARLAGEYMKIDAETAKELEKGRMTVEDLSRTGLGFRTMSKHNLHVHDSIHVRFYLDDAQHSEVSKSAVVKRVDDYTVGAEFLDFDAYNDTNRRLGLYLMPR